MMNKTMVMKKDRRKRDIKSKLLAAIAMLMVSCIMVVSSTYAWFTLSTAPEVKGISTAIGANGNLEMALLPSFGAENAVYGTVDAALAGIGDAAGSMTTLQKNTTWGNLVDLSDSSYGLDKISLFPAQLAATDGQLSTYYLGTPVYGADGRFIEVSNTAMTAVHNNGSFSTNAFGVRVVGTSSGMSAMEIAYRDALSSANDAFNKAVNQTKNSAAVGGSSLASIAVKKASEDTPVYTEKDIASLVTTYTAMDGALDSIEVALKQYIIAAALGSGTYSEETYSTLLTTVENASLADMKSHATGELKTYIDTLIAMQTEVGNTLTALNELTPRGTTTETLENGDTQELDTFAWDDFKDYLSALADTDKMLLNNHPISYYIDNGMANVGELVSNMQNLVLEVNATADAADTGLYVQMADFVDDFSTPVAIKNIKYGSLNLKEGVTATMKVYASKDPAYLPNAKAAASVVSDGVFSAGGSNISDYFGYIIDMAFRTNAAGSNLQLQTEGIDRIYDDNSTPDTMGGGSTMTFGYDSSNDFTEAGLEKLMGYIRVVFFDPESMQIMGYARLDPSTAVPVTDETSGGVEVTMQLKMWDEKSNGGEGGWATSSAITALQQNTATAVSTLVYLDGAELTNADVANVELTGTMNIQFSSDADLKPMEYGNLQGASDEYSVTVNGVTLSEKVAKGNSYSANISQFSEQLGGKTVDTVTVKMGGTVVNAYDAGTGAISITDVSGDIVVEVTFKADQTPETTTPATTG